MFSATYHSPVGRMTLVASDAALLGAWFEGQRHFGGNWLPAVTQQRETPLLSAARAWLDAYFDGRRPEAILPLAPVGTPFQLAVWRLLRQIPYGSVTTYGMLTEQLRALGVKACPQAVGSAVGRNPVSVFIPCHRVIGSDGSLTGYAAGLETKSFLLQLESRSNEALPKS